MSIVSSQLNMSSSNLLHTINHKDSNLKRKRYLDNIETLEENKKARTAPPSPPMATVFRSRSLSPTPPSSQPASNSIKTIVPSSPQLHKTSFVPSTPPLSSAVLDSQSPTSSNVHKTQLPSINSITSNLPTTSDYKYLKQNDRYGSSHHSLDYPDTCVNDDDWRMNMEIWFEKNFPEKFNNLKNLLRFDKPGFDLLNDAIFLNELKEKLDTERRIKIDFNSRISKKMVSSPERRHNPYYQRRVISDPSEDMLKSAPTFSKFSTSPIVPNIAVGSSAVKFPLESNYTYCTNEPQHRNQEPQSPITHSVSTSRRPSISLASLAAADHHAHHHQDYPHQDHIHSQSDLHHHTSPTPTPTRPLHNNTTQLTAQWNGHHQLNKPSVLETNTFIHTHNHKGPNHTYTIHHHSQAKRRCISCGSDQSPCWRPSWSTAAGQLCNSCGLRYKKTGARCTVKRCGRIPAKGEWTAMKSRGKVPVTGVDGVSRLGYSCLHCGGEVEVKDKAK